VVIGADNVTFKQAAASAAAASAAAVDESGNAEGGEKAAGMSITAIVQKMLLKMMDGGR
jgi:hypothetical protein